MPIAITRASGWSLRSRRLTAWCWSDEYPSPLCAPGAFCGNRALRVDGVVLPGAVRSRAQDQPVADRDRAAALRAGVRPDAGVCGIQDGARLAISRQFPADGLR